MILSGLPFAQNGTKSVKDQTISTSMFQATYSFQLPGADTKTTYGFSNTIGGSFIYKTDQNWLWTLNGNFIFGNQLNLDRIGIFGEGITTVDGEVISGDGIFSSFATYERGAHFQVEIGKLFPYKPNPNSGFFIQAGLGYLFNRIRIEDQFDITPQIANDYKYGYDQMRGGFASHAEAGYLFMSDTRIFNWSVSLEVTYARTKHLRDYDFRVFYDESGTPRPVGPTDPNKRYNDLYYGIRVSWIIPTYQRQPEEFYYH
jgi:hypothetical protein